jgi:AAA domain
VGQGGTGKSLLMFDIAMAMATGQSVLGHTPAEPMSVLYIDMENPVGEVYTRRANLGYHDNSLERLTYYHMPDLPALDTKSGGKFIEALAERHSPASSSSTRSRNSLRARSRSLTPGRTCTSTRWFRCARTIVPPSSWTTRVMTPVEVPVAHLQSGITSICSGSRDATVT